MVFIFGLALLALIGMGIVFYDPRVQTFLAKKAADYLSKELKTQVTIESIKVIDLHKIGIQGLLVLDQNRDTLIHITTLKLDALDFHNLDFKNNSLRIDEISLDSTQFYLHTNLKQESNLDFILRYFNSGKGGPSKPYHINLHKLSLHNIRFRYSKEGNELSIPHRINFSDLDLSNLNLELNNFYVKGSEIGGQIANLALKEKSGFVMKKVAGQFDLGNNFLKLSHFYLETPKTRIQSQMAFHFLDWSAFSDFENQVTFQSRFEKSQIFTDDLGYFTSTLDNIHIHARLEGRVMGKIDSLSLKNMVLKTGSNTEIGGNFLVKNLTQTDKTFIETFDGRLQTDRKDLKEFFKGIGQVHVLDKIPNELSSVNAILVTGTYKGSFSQFATQINIQTSLGQLLANVHFSNPKKGIPYYNGTLSSTSFPIGTLLQEPNLGKVGFISKITGRGFGSQTHLDSLESNLKYLDYNGYRYQNIRVQGSQHQKSFSGKIRINDPNLVLAFRGIIDLNSKIPLFNFKADITKADLLKLGYIKDSLEIQTKLNISFSGNSLSNLNGRILATESNLKKGSKSFSLDSILIGAEKNGLEKNLYIRSCILDANIRGRYDFKNLPIELKEVIGKYLPSTHWNTQKTAGNQEFTSDVHIKDLTPITSIFYPSLFISPDTRFFGDFNSKNQVLSINGVFPEVALGSIRFQSVILDAENLEKGSFDINISTDAVLLGKNILSRSLNLANNVNRDSLKFNLKVEDVNSVNHLDLNGLIEVNNTQGGLSILPSVLVLENKIWKIENSFRIGFEAEKTVIKGFRVSHIPDNPILPIESLDINGILSSKAKDSVITRFNHFDLSTLNQIIKQYGFTLSGSLNGNARFSAVLGQPSFTSKLKIDSLGLNGNLIGDADLNNDWEGEKSNLLFNGTVKNQILSMIHLDGKLGLSQKNDGIEAVLNMDHASAALLEPFTKGIVSHISGSLSSKILISGKRDHPIINGNLAFNSTELTVDYLNTHYKILDSVAFTKSNVNLEHLKLVDPDGNLATVAGSIDLSPIDNPYLDDVTLHAVNFLTLNTNEKQGDEYYGKAYSTGYYAFNGPLNQIHMDFEASTMPHTTLNIPLNRPNSVGKKDFITFVSIRDSLNTAIKKRISHLGISLDFDLTITPDASVKLIFDDKIGDVIRGSGNSDLNIQLTPLGDFLIYGDFEIEKGDYLFTSQNILNKLFTIEKGGSIRFSGDPLNADIDLFADYQARADITPLYKAASVTSLYSTSSANVLVSSIIHLSGTLSNPSFDFNLKFPLAPYIEQELSTYLNSKQVVATQSMLFLISNQFKGELTAANGKGIAISTGIQFVGNQLSNLLNNFSNRLDLNVRSLQDYGIAYRTLSNRLQFTGNVTNAANDATNSITNIIIPFSSNQLIGNAEAIYTLNKKGTLRVKGFWREVPVDFLQTPSSNGVLIDPPITYTQGIGILFTKEFSSFHDFFTSSKKKNPEKLSAAPIKKDNQGIGNKKTKIVFKEINP